MLRINKKYIEILKNPYESEFIELTSNKCPKCQRARVGNYRIIFYVSESKKQIEIIDIIPIPRNLIYFWMKFFIIIDFNNIVILFL